MLEKVSDYHSIKIFCGYNPERINPGDKINTLLSYKITTGFDAEDK